MYPNFVMHQITVGIVNKWFSIIVVNALSINNAIAPNS